MASFKLAAILEGIHFRHLRGQTVGEGFERIGAVLEPIAEAGLVSRRTIFGGPAVPCATPLSATLHERPSFDRSARTARSSDAGRASAGEVGAVDKDQELIVAEGVVCLLWNEPRNRAAARIAAMVDVPVRQARGVGATATI